MNGNDILRAMNGLDEKYIVSAGRSMTLKRGRLGKRAVRIAVGIAAAIALAVPAGAFCKQFIHKAAVQKYFTEESVEYLEANGLVLDQTAENEHIRLTVDTLLSDGHIGSMVLTVEGLDEEGLQCVENQPYPEIYLRDAQTGEYVVIHENGSAEIIGTGAVDYDTCTGTQFTVWRELELDGIDTDRDYILTFGINTYEAERDEYGVITDNLAEGISIKASFRPNVAVKELESDEGEKLWLSQIGFYSNEQGVIDKLKYRNRNNEMRLLRNDSVLKDKVSFAASTLDWSPERKQPLAVGWFDSIVEIDKYEGVEIGGTKYIEIEQ